MKFFPSPNFVVSICLNIFLILVPFVVQAQGGGGNNPTYIPNGGGGANNTVSLMNPLRIESICNLLQEFLKILLTFGVPISVLFLAYSGFLFVKARGNPKELIRARSNFVHVILGILLFLGAWMLGQIVASTINTLGAGNNAPGVGSCR